MGSASRTSGGLGFRQTVISQPEKKFVARQSRQGMFQSPVPHSQQHTPQPQTQSSQPLSSRDPFYAQPLSSGIPSLLQRPPQNTSLPSQQLGPVAMSAAVGVSRMPPASDFAAADYNQIFEWVSQLLKGPEGREKALLELSRKREQYEDLALILWHSFGYSLLSRTNFRCHVDSSTGDY